MVTLNVTNAGASVQDRFASFRVPNSVAATLGDYISLSTGETGVKVWDDTRNSMYTVRKAWAAGLTAPTVTALGSNPGWTFALHAAYGGTTCGQPGAISNNLLVRARLILPGGGSVDMHPNFQTVTPVPLINGARQARAVWISHYNGFHVEQVMDFYHEHAVADVGVKIVWSDELASEWWRPAVAIELAFGFEIKPWGFVETNQKWTSSNSGKTWRLSMTWPAGGQVSPGCSWNANTEKLWHGITWLFRGWMLGRTSTVVAADETIFANLHYLDALVDRTTWEGGYMLSGHVPPIADTSGVDRPDYSQTTKHYISWDCGYGGNDGAGGTPAQGMAPHTNNRVTGFQGSLDFIFGHQVIDLSQPLYDVYAGLTAYCQRAVWIRRDGSYPGPLQGMALDGGYPFVSSGSTNFGRDPVTLPGNSYGHFGNLGGGTFRYDNQHLSFMVPAALYELTGDYLCYSVIQDWLHARALDQRRGMGIGSPMSGQREPGRTIIATAIAGRVVPVLQGLANDITNSPSIGYCYQALRNCHASRNQTLGPMWLVGPGVLTQAEIDVIVAAAPAGYGSAAANIRFKGQDGMFEGWFLLAMWYGWQQTGDPDFREMFEKIGTSLFLHQTFYLDSATHGGVTGWYLAYDINAPVDGYTWPEDWRVYGHPMFDTILRSEGGPAIRAWGIAGCDLYVRVGQNDAAKVRAAEVMANCKSNYWGTFQAAHEGILVYP